MLVHSALAFASASALLVAAHADPRLVRRAPAPAGEPSTATVAAAATKTHKVAAAAADSTVTAVATTDNVQIKAAAQSALPLTQYTYAYDQVPYQVNPYPSVRGPQSGYNQCNSTTEGDDALCQTLIANDIKDFCLWGSDLTGTELDTIGDIEAAVVSYCTQKGHGGRSIKGGAITGVQVLKTEAYIQWTGFIDQTALHLTADDSGGELDPHGADLQGGLVYSSGLPSGDNKTLEQAVEWNLFIGGGVFCLKLCDPEYYKKTGTFFCENRYDRMGCSYNMPASYVDKEFSVCDSELQDVVGVYTGTDGKTSTYSQPPEGTAPNPPYTPRVPKSSNCQTYASTDLFEAVSTSAASSSASASGASMTSGSMSAGASQSASGTGTAASQGAGGNSGAVSSTRTGSGASMWLASSGFVALVAGALAVLA
ncbi:uncharacterized protein RHOBADRAFT_45616 [Rhodotorula graminis WP1]|uniref:Macrofage activating glycoprotein n=1 Tax=Rhodotorula graminis (strain WP1) TaxID=578459 RepID=A0A0P9EWI4_RHOGW|nr:uncharacterized protein RHOBADRAFT_45616 [Rhodotorula graminis WP1]KPV73655.1 hypothetical protein RHOBADRAFT_45616 [Rhodotorula graminis WP1]